MRPTANPWVYMFLTIIGVAAAYIGEFVVKGNNVEGISGLLIGWGSALAAIGAGNVMQLWWLKKPENKAKYQEQMRLSKIDAKDERKIRIREKAGWKTNITIFFILMAVTVVFSILDVEQWVIMTLCGIFIFQLALGIILFNYYAKRM